MQFSGSGTDAQAVEDCRVAGAVEAEIFGSHAQGQHLKGNSFGFGQCDGLPDQLRVIDHARVAGGEVYPGSYAVRGVVRGGEFFDRGPVPIAAAT